jgi:hypothetical protein
MNTYKYTEILAPTGTQPRYGSNRTPHSNLDQDPKSARQSALVPEYSASPVVNRQPAAAFLSHQTAALLDANALTARRDNFGVSLSTMTPARIAEASEA